MWALNAHDGRPVADRPLADGLREVVECLVHQPLFFGLVVDGGERLVDPAVHCDLMAPALENGRNLLRVQEGAHRRNEERRRHLVPVEQFQNARQTTLSPEIRGAERGRGGLPARQEIRLVVNVEAEAHGHARVARPRSRRQLAPHACRRDGLPKLLFGPARARLRVGIPRLPTTCRRRQQNTAAAQATRISGASQIDARRPLHPPASKPRRCPKSGEKVSDVVVWS